MAMKIIMSFFKEKSILKFSILSILGLIFVVVMSIKFNLYMYQILCILLVFYFLLKYFYCSIFGVYND